MPQGTMPVSPCTISTWSNGTPSFSETIWAKAVSWPWPWLWLPVSTETLPVGLNLMLADSHWPTPAPSDPTAADGARPQDSMKQEKPRPRSLPRASEAALRAG